MIWDNNSIPNAVDMPSQFYEGKTDDDKREWFRRWSLWVAQKYNTPNNLVRNIPGHASVSRLGYADKFYRNYAYYMGMQENVNYKFSEYDDKGQRLGTNWQPGQNIRRLMKHLRGKMENVILSLDITIKATSKEALEEKSLAKEKLQMLQEQKHLLAQFAEMGMTFNPEGADQIKSKDDIDEYLESKQSQGEVWFSDVATDIWLRNNMVQKASIGGGIQSTVLATSAFHVRVENGYVLVDLPDSTAIVWDGGTGFDPLNTKMNYAGLWTGQYSPAQIIAMYGDKIKEAYGETEYNNIKTATSATYGSMWPGVNFNSGNFEWLSSNSAGISMSVFRAYWIASDELEEESVPYYTQAPEKNKFGYKPYVKSKDNKPKNPGLRVYQCDIVAGLYVVNCQPLSNQITDPFNPANPIIPLFVFNSDVTMGETVSLVDELFQSQDRLDFINQEINIFMAKNLGKNFLFRRSQIGDTRLAEIFNDFRTMSVSIAEDSDGDEVAKQITMGTLVDLTQDERIASYLTLYDRIEQGMERVINLSEISMGAQSGYVSNKVQTTSIEQNSTGNASLFNWYVVHLERTLAYATNVGKVIYSMGDDNVMLMSREGMKYLKESRDQTLETYGLYLRLHDSISEKQRASLLDFSLMLVQQGRLTELDMLELYSAKTFSRLKAYFRKAIAIRDEKSKEAQGAADMQAMLMEQERIGAENAREAARLETASGTATLNAETKLADTVLKEKLKQEGQAQVPA